MRRLFEQFRNRTHTGERRCWPCTAANLLILLFACAAVARRRSRSLAAALGVCGAGVIALRGYLVPYTPEVAPRIATRLPRDPFHAGTNASVPEAPDASGSLGDGGDEATGERVLEALLEQGVVVEDVDGLHLDDAFRAAWRSTMRKLRDSSDDELAAALREAGPEGAVVDVVESGGWTGDDETWFVISDGSDDPANENWLTRHVAIAEAAAVRALADETDLDAARRAQAAGPLRTLLQACPVCDGRVEEATEMECCGGPGSTRPDAPDDVLACVDCGERLYTFR